MENHDEPETGPSPVTFEDWFSQLWERHTADLSFQEIRKAVQALSRRYVEMRENHISRALGSAGKRAGFALFYGPLHFLLVRSICQQLHVSIHSCDQIVDLGCGTGVSSAAWALEGRVRPVLAGIDRNSWAVEETRWTYRTLGLGGSARCADITRIRLSGPRLGIVAGFTVNELSHPERAKLKSALLEAGARGGSILVVEPISRRLTPWWGEWAETFLKAGGRADEWRFEVSLPEPLKLLDKAAGLDHRELTGRSLWLPPDS